MCVGPRDVGNNLPWRIFHVLPYLHRREHHIDLLRPVLEEGLGERDALGKVEIRLYGLAEHTALQIDTFHLAAHQFHARKR